MRFTKEQQDFIKNANQHTYLLTGGRGHSKTKELIESLQQELDQYKNILEDIDKYIHSFKIEYIGEKTMLILNDILLIKNGLGKDVVRLNKMKELEEDK